METSFWNKLKKTIMTAPKEPPSSAFQLSRFNKCWLTIQTAISTPEKRIVAIQQTEIPARLKNMVDLLVDEESRLDDATGSTGVCMEYLLKNNVLMKLVNTCDEGDQPRGIMGETIRTVASMINLLDDRFLVHNAVHQPTVKLLRTCCAPGIELEDNESYHEDLIDLMYILCSKIHGYPELLNIFFYDKQWLTIPERVAAKRLQRSRETIALLRSLSHRSSLALSSLASDSTMEDVTSSSEERKSDPASRNSDKFVENEDDPPTFFAEAFEISATNPPDPEGEQESKRDYEFLLFTYLSKFVHREGKAGDFARTGLLFLMELATGSLGEYILDSDFATYLTAGVGALYSQLPRNLIVRGGPNDLTGSNSSDSTSPTESKPSRRANIELSTSSDFQSRLDAFLKVLEFCQDVLMRCPNSEIATTLLASFKTVFLENILYPSILECSDTDGSSVAVISYIDQILQILEHEALVDLVVGFLMESEENENRSKEPQDTDAFAEVQNPQTTSPYFTATGWFTLKDLVLSRLKSRSQPTVIATLKLLNTIITRHCKYSLRLLNIQPDTRTTAIREQAHGTTRELSRETPMVNHHAHGLDLFFALIATINPHNTPEIFCCGYEAYLRDAEGSVEAHQCLTRAKDNDTHQEAGTVSDTERKKHRRRSMKYGHRMELPEEPPFDLSVREFENNSDLKSASGCCGKGPGHEHGMQMHRLLPSDPLLQILLGTLSHFFAHSVELNLALTGVITSLAVCPYRSLEGWLLFRTSDVKKPDVDRGSGEESESDSPRNGLLGVQTFAQFDPTCQTNSLYDSDDEETMPFFAQTGSSPVLPAGPPSFKSFPPFFTMLRTLTQQVDYYRSEIDGFDEYLAERRRALLLSGDTNHVANAYVGSVPPVPSVEQFPMGNSFNPGNMHVSNDSFFTVSGDFSSGARPSTPTMSGSSASLIGLAGAGPTSPRILGSVGNLGVGSRVTSPAPQRAMSKTPVAGSLANPVTMLKISTPRARKSSSPSSLMSTPSNMPFLVPPGVGGKRNFKSNSASPLAGGSGVPGPRYPSVPAANESESQTVSSPSQPPARSLATSPGPLSQPRALWAVTPSLTPGASRSMVVGGMVTTGSSVSLTGQGATISSVAANVINSSSTNAISSQSTAPMVSHAQSQFGSFGTNPLAKIMDTMMIRPLFADGFVDDSDCEAESDLQIKAKLDDYDDDNDDDSQSNNSSKKNRSSEDGDMTDRDRGVNSDLQEPNTPGGGNSRGTKNNKHGREGSSSATLTSSASTSNDNNNNNNINNNPPNKKIPQEKMVTLGQLLTNVVILEEVVKEVVAVAQVRKAMGVDKPNKDKDSLWHFLCASPQGDGDFL